MNTQKNGSVHSRTDIKNALLHVHDISKRKKSEDDEFYRLDRSDASQYLKGFPKWRKKISAYFSTLKEQKQSIVFVDVCGRASGAYLGADKNYSFSLQPINPFFAHKKDTRIEGDIFSMSDFGSFVNLLRKRGDRPAFVTFDPYAGLGDYTPPARSDGNLPLKSEVTYQLLINNLRRMVSVLRGGGFIMIGRPFSMDTRIIDFLKNVPQERWRSTEHMRAICAKLKCSIEIGPTIRGPYWLLRKRARK